MIITEDSNSGYQFFEQVCRENHLKCESMNGKSNIFHYLNIHKDEKVLVIADGAAFGSEMDKVQKLIADRKNVALYLPESFEWLILSSGILKKGIVTAILRTPYDYVESENILVGKGFLRRFLSTRQKILIWHI